MDNSHVALVSVKLNATGFKRYRCDRPMPLGVNLTSLTKVLKCAKDDDLCTLSAADDADVLNLIYEARSEFNSIRVKIYVDSCCTDTDRIAEYAMKLMDIDTDTLGIPDTDYDARVTMPSSEFSRIVRDLSQLGESVRIEVSKEGVRFASEGEAANGNILLRHTDSSGANGKKGGSSKVKKEGDDDDEEEEANDDEDEEGEKKVKKEKVKKEEGEDVEMDGEEEEDDAEFKAESDGEEEQDEDGSSSKKRKKAPSKVCATLASLCHLLTVLQSEKPAKKAKKGKSKDDDDDVPDGVRIEMNQHVNLTFSLKYLVNFSKSATLSNVVQLMMSNDVPLLVSIQLVFMVRADVLSQVSYDFNQGYIRYYLAPKIGDD